MEKWNTKKAMSSLFVLGLGIAFIRSGGYTTIQKIADAAVHKDVNINAIDSDFTSNLWIQHELIDINGIMEKLMGMRGYYSNMGMYVAKGNYIVSSSPETSTDYEYNQISALADFLKEHDIHLLYVNEPTKYVDDNFFKENFGVDSFSNRNMDKFLGRIREKGIPTIDLRENIREEGLNIKDFFYRTDHHWTTKATLWAVKIIADGLNKYCGYSIDTSLYNVDNYDMVEYKKAWLGEQGRKVSGAYVGLDDFTEIKPKFETSYTFKFPDGNKDGTFDMFVNEDLYDKKSNVYSVGSWHYSYNRLNCINHNVNYGKILLLGDSYEQTTEPFLSLGIKEVDSLVMREVDDSFDLKQYILDNHYDTVIIAYAQFMVGAHDDSTSANYKMFSFDKSIQ